MTVTDEAAQVSETLRKRLRKFETSNIDQVILLGGTGAVAAGVETST